MSAGRLTVNNHNPSRAGRYLGRAQLNVVSQVKACRECGLATISSNGSVGVRATGAFGVDSGITSGYAGLSTCGRIWLCPVCNSKVMAHRALEIGSTLAWAGEQGYFVLWGSLTVRHRLADSLQRLIRIQTGAWRRLVQSKLWASWATSRGGDRIGYIRASEITIGLNGWHPHFHPIIIVRGDRTAAVHFGQRLVQLWIAAVIAEGGEAIADGVEGSAQKLSVLTAYDAADGLNEYVTKSQYRPQALALEAVWSQSKDSADRKPRVRGTLAHWSLLEAASQGLALQALSWWELEDSTQGHRMITWSRDLRSLAGLNETEVSDETVAALELGSVEDTVCFITSQGWRDMRSTPSLKSSVLDELEQHGWAGLRLFLDYHGIEWYSVDEANEYGVATQLVKKLGPIPRVYRSFRDREKIVEGLSAVLKLDDVSTTA